VTVYREEIARLDLTGSLLLLRFMEGSPVLLSLDLESGELTSVFHPAKGAWVTAADASTQAGRIAMAYSPAPPGGQAQSGFTGISLLPLDGSGEPEEFIPPVEGQSLFSFPAWSPDGSILYYNQFQYGSQAGGLDIPVIGQLGYPAGAAEELVRLGRWPRISPDGEGMVFVSVRQEAGIYLETLEVLDLAAEAAEPALVPLGPEIEVLDMPLFSPDGEMLYFSAPSPEGVPAGPSILDRLAGVSTASAHDVPSDWFRVTLQGGPAERLTRIGGTGLYGVFSPDGTRMAFITNRGVQAMNPDGSDLSTLVEGDGFFGTIDWVP
jgi:hypothetical protein